MSTSTTPRNACLRLLISSFAIAHLDKAANLSDVLVLLEADPNLRPNFEINHNGQPLWSAMLNALGQRDRNGQVVPPVRVRESSRLLYNIFKGSGLDMSASGPIMTSALTLGLPALVSYLDADEPLTIKQISAILDKDPIIPPAVLKDLRREWKNHPRLTDLLSGLTELSKSYGWMSAEVDIKQVQKLRGTHPWTTREADKYLLDVVIPSVNASPLLSNPIRLMGHSKVNSDGRAMVYAISPAAWHKALYSNPAPPPRHFLLPKLHAQMFNNRSAAEPFDIPAPPTEWFRELIEQYDNSTGRDELKSGQGHQIVLRQLGMLLFEKTRDAHEMDWDVLALSLKSMNLAFGVLTPPKGIVAWVDQNLSKDPSPPPMEKATDPVVAGMMLGLWISQVNSTSFYQHVASWEKLTRQPHPKGEEQTKLFHGCVANALYLRFVRGQDDRVHWPQLASLFWSHALRSDGKSLSSLVKKALVEVPNTRPNIFTIDPTCSLLNEVLLSPSNLPKVNDMKALQKCFLTLKAAQANRGEFARPAAPKM